MLSLLRSRVWLSVMRVLDLGACSWARAVLLMASTAFASMHPGPACGSIQNPEIQDAARRRCMHEELKAAAGSRRLSLQAASAVGARPAACSPGTACSPRTASAAGGGAGTAGHSTGF